MRSEKINYAGVAGAIGGLLGFIGVFAYWWTYSWVATGATLTVAVRGTADWTGVAALVAGIAAFAFGGAYLLMDDPSLRRITGTVMGIGAIFLLTMTVAGMFRTTQAIGVPLVAGQAGSTVTFSTALDAGIYVSFLGGVVAVVGTILMVAGSSKDASAAPDAPAA
jgi:hypothetical protein